MTTDKDFSPDAAGLAEALDWLIEARSRPGDPHPPTRELPLPAAWPREGVGGRRALAMLRPVALDSAARFDAPGFFAHMDPPTPWMTWMAAAWAAALNQNLLHPESAPAARPLERRVVEWLAPEFGMSGGHITPGSTLANLTALWAAREITGAHQVVASRAAHVSIAKSARILGLRLVEVPVDERRRLRRDLLPQDLSDSILALTAGTTVTGSIDPLDTGAGAAWRHVDAAWAGPLRMTSGRSLLDGIETADSVVFSAHKWLYQPKESALVLFARAARAQEALSFGGDYLAAPNIGVLGSHGATALPLAATLLAWGRAGVAERIEADLALAARLADRVTAEPELELWGEPVTGIVVWRPRDADVAALHARLHEAWVSLAYLDGEPWLRSVADNPLADPDLVVDAVLEAARATRR